MATLHPKTSKITPFIWFDNNAEEAVRFYTSIFKDSRIGLITRYGDGGPMPKGTVMTVSFELAGQPLIAMNGGTYVKLNEAFSLMVMCDTQAEIDDYWAKLTADGGAAVQCGWLRDRFGLSWQIVPAATFEWLSDPAKCHRVMAALMQMVKLDLATLEAAARGG